jgi:hypothetical protein
MSEYPTGQMSRKDIATVERLRRAGAAAREVARLIRQHFPVSGRPPSPYAFDENTGEGSVLKVYGGVRILENTINPDGHPYASSSRSKCSYLDGADLLALVKPVQAVLQNHDAIIEHYGWRTVSLGRETPEQIQQSSDKGQWSWPDVPEIEEEILDRLDLAGAELFRAAARLIPWLPCPVDPARAYVPPSITTDGSMVTLSGGYSPTDPSLWLALEPMNTEEMAAVATTRRERAQDEEDLKEITPVGPLHSTQESAATVAATSEKRRRELDELEPAHRKAYFSFLYAEAKQGGSLEDREAYDFLKEHGVPDGPGSGELGGYELPDFTTWSRYLRQARKALDERKHTPRGARSHGGSVVKASQLDPRRSESD